jgi:hypothetical protein
MRTSAYWGLTLRQEAGRDGERRVFVLRDVGHDLGDSALDIGRQPGRSGPWDVGCRVPRVGGGTFGERGDLGCPQRVALVEAPVVLGAAGLGDRAERDEAAMPIGAPGRRSEGGTQVVHPHRAISRQRRSRRRQILAEDAGARAAPDADDPAGGAGVVVGALPAHRVPVDPRPRRELEPSRPRSEHDVELFAGGEACERGGDQDLQAAAELERSGVEPADAHVSRPCSRMASVRSA